MATKLTLSLDSKIIESAKKYAKRHGTSISRLVEEHLASITKFGTSRQKKEPLESLKKIKGIASSLNDGSSYKDLITDSIIQKHLK